MKALLLSLTLGFIPLMTMAQTVRTLSPAAYQQSLAEAKRKTVLDVRTPAEFREGHLAGAINIDVRNESFRQQVAKLPVGDPVYVYCLSGVRSMAAARILEELGFKRIVNLQGGIRAWQQAGLPIDTK